MKRQSIPLDEAEVTNIMHALQDQLEAYKDQLNDPGQSNVHVLCEMKIREVEALIGRLERTYEENLYDLTPCLRCGKETDHALCYECALEDG